MDIFDAEMDTRSSKRLRVWESLLGGDDVKAQDVSSSEPVAEGGRDCDSSFCHLPDTVPDSVPEAWQGPVGWVARLRHFFDPLYLSLGPQKEKLTMHHLCAGTGSASLALRVLWGQQACALEFL